MQVDAHCSYLWQLDSETIDRIGLELGEYKRFELTELFETWEAMPTFLKRFPSIMESTNGRLQHLGMYFTQMWKLFLGFGQVVLLQCIGRKWRIGRNDVFLVQRASVYR